MSLSEDSKLTLLLYLMLMTCQLLIYLLLVPYLFSDQSGT